MLHNVVLCVASYVDYVPVQILIIFDFMVRRSRSHKDIYRIHWTLFKMCSKVHVNVVYKLDRNILNNFLLNCLCLNKCLEIILDSGAQMSDTCTF